MSNFKVSINNWKNKINIDTLNELENSVKKWQHVGFLEGLSVWNQIKLKGIIIHFEFHRTQMLEAGTKFVNEFANGIYDDVDEFQKFKTVEDLAGIILPAISRKYKIELNVFDLEDLIILLNRNAGLYYQLEEKAVNPIKNIKPKYLFDYTDHFLTTILNDR